MCVEKVLSVEKSFELQIEPYWAVQRYTFVLYRFHWKSHKTSII